MIPLIALEEHYLSTVVTQAQKVDRYADFPPHIPVKLKAFGEERMRDMDNGQLLLQVLSHAPGIRLPAICTAANDELALKISKNSNRLAGFAMLPMNDPIDAANELRRCIKDLQFVGALIDNHVHGEYYDNQRFWVVFQMAEELKVPIYIHPSFPVDRDRYEGDYNQKIATALSAFGWGWHSDTALSILKMFASGFFDRFTKIKIIIGHMGEMIPFQLERIISTTGTWGLKRGFKQVWEENIWITTSGMFALPPLQCLLQTTSISHILYSVDYPFSSNEKGLAFVEEVRQSGLLSEADFEKFAYGNAQDLLGLKVYSGSDSQ
ncbi:amidohydrolase family protein [Aspergillus saccharolyticus JOP 1030-1]|uniref:Putative 2,3-dihydroxybenzoic acid decarboxylase n=1 Tax=Aspergillus saccharolyticus JOP 1030-1 TaxID=1450539 RepID=A0A318ZYL6_9EURO|nr:putative 2,3-dihydroxybenzoic acid decarboxylase [Aspergillus saccharolyticus JOP 1030-1]PYH40472.1 putative 2,3-dihydroxybenzoic acid decarboxylase [Aspergillus saccharolyticus JOP 1030-1]